MNDPEDIHTPDLTLRGQHLSLARPVVMGILNTTPDSFSDGGRYTSLRQATDRIAEMIEQGATIIDIGGESTRPGADPVPAQQELNRTLPVLEEAIPLFPDTLFSIDTTKYEVAKAALQAGAHIVNDVSGLRAEPRLARLCADYEAGYVLMHSQGDPKTMQVNPEYDDVVSDIHNFFSEKRVILNETGVKSIMIDPGIGFGKTLQHNLEIIAGLKKFSTLGYPLLIGASRKSMIGRLLNNRPAEGRLAGTIAVHYHSLCNGAKILRVHDVQEAADAIDIFTAISTCRNR